MFFVLYDVLTRIRLSLSVTEHEKMHVPKLKSLNKNISSLVFAFFLNDLTAMPSTKVAHNPGNAAPRASPGECCTIDALPDDVTTFFYAGHIRNSRLVSEV